MLQGRVGRQLRVSKLDSVASNSGVAEAVGAVPSVGSRHRCYSTGEYIPAFSWQCARARASQVSNQTHVFG
jgi:hypothetical protein